MRIEILAQRDGNIVAYELIDDCRTGEFHLSPTGEVWYLHSDTPPMFANANESSFRAASAAWHSYCETVVKEASDAAQLQCVDDLRVRLDKHLAQTKRQDSFWGVILEQAESGLL